uniref:Uncharacterized protein n=1 Tax=Schizaphis graminum TaxID=13262 RepID=A0A2S2NZQ5_SCHGA
MYASVCVFALVSVYKRIGCRTSLQSRATVDEVRERRSARRRFRRLIAPERRLIEERINRATDGRSPTATPHLDRTRSRTQTRTNTRIHASFFFPLSRIYIYILYYSTLHARTGNIYIYYFFHHRRRNFTLP